MEATNVDKFYNNGTFVLTAPSKFKGMSLYYIRDKGTIGVLRNDYGVVADIKEIVPHGIIAEVQIDLENKHAEFIRFDAMLF